MTRQRQKIEFSQIFFTSSVVVAGMAFASPLFAIAGYCLQVL